MQRNNGINLSGLNPINHNSNNTTPNTLGGLNLSKGMSLNLEKFVSLEEVEFGLGWTENNRARSNRFDFDLDASALILMGNGRVRDAQDVIYYNQLNTNRGVFSEGDNRIGSADGNDDCEVINVDLSRVPQYCESVKIIVTIFDANKRNQNFGMVDNAYIACRDKKTGQELGRYTLSDEFALDTAVEMGELRRTQRGWEFKALGNGSQNELFGVLISHGVQ